MPEDSRGKPMPKMLVRPPGSMRGRHAGMVWEPGPEIRETAVFDADGD